MAEQCEHIYQVGCHIKSAFAGFVGEGTDAVVDSWAGAMLKGLDRTLISVGTFWVNVATPDVSDGEASKWAANSTTWVVVVVGSLSLIFACGLLVWNLRGEMVREIVAGFFRLIFVSAGAVMVVQALIIASDETASWLVERATDTADGTFSAKIMTISAIDPGSTTTVVVLVLGLIGVIANLIQMGLMYVRSAMLIILLAVIPVAAAASMLEWGKQWLYKMLAWTMSFILAKPVAGLVYAIGIKLVSTNSSDDGLESFILGAVTMVLAPLALPALMSMIVPAAVRAGGGGGAGAAAAGAAGLATGAVAVGDLSGFGSSSGGEGASGPAGAKGGTGDSPQGPSGAGDEDASGPGSGSVGPGSGPAGGEASGAAGAGAAASGAAGASAAASGAATGGVSTAVQAGVQAAGAVADAAQQTADEATGAGQEAQ